MFRPRLLMPLLLILVCLGTAGGQPPHNIPPLEAPVGWKLTFHDEFDKLDLSHWNTKFQRNNRYLGGQGEKEMYVDPTYAGDTSRPLDLNPFSVENGILTIEADRAPPAVRAHLEGQLYTSGLLTTERYFSQLYGYFEIRTQYPLGKGLWPGFWMLATDLSWPPEIDIVELRGDQPETLYATVHYQEAGNPHAKTSFRPAVADFTKNFHTYGLLWTPDFIAWYVDGHRVAYTVTPANVKKPMYLLIQLAVGGDWLGQPDEKTKFPAKMQIDYVRAYALPSIDH